MKRAHALTDILLIAVLGCAGVGCDADRPVDAQAARLANEPGPGAFTGGELHAPFSALLSRCVDRGVVDYAALKRERPALDTYLAALAATDPASLGRTQATAFWINAYNAFTLALIDEHLPGIQSIKDIPASERWKDERWLVHGRRYSLDTIENGILRPLGDPRIHFALVCASRSCPDLADGAYVPERLDSQLDAVTRAFLADRDKGLSFTDESGAILGSDYVLRLSKIFDWYRQDFAASAGSVVDFVLRYAPVAAATFIRIHRDDLDVEFLDYDWALNGR